jgi:hypothetical protein
MEEVATLWTGGRGQKRGRMAKRLAVLAAAVGVLALVVSMVVPAVADNGDDRVTLRLAEKAADDERFFSFIDVGKKGESVGDYLVLKADPIYNRSRTKKVGVVHGDCLVVEEARSECDVTFDLEGGLITEEGPIDFAERSDVVQVHAVTGGTGVYKTAHGELELDFSEAQKGILFTFRLIL